MPLECLHFLVQIPFGDPASVLAKANSNAVSLSNRCSLSVSCVRSIKAMFSLHVLPNLFERVTPGDVEVDDEALERFPILVLESP